MEDATEPQLQPAKARTAAIYHFYSIINMHRVTEPKSRQLLTPQRVRYTVSQGERDNNKKGKERGTHKGHHIIAENAVLCMLRHRLEDGGR